MASKSPAGYSGTQILLHWIIAALVLFQSFSVKAWSMPITLRFRAGRPFRE